MADKLVPALAALGGAIAAALAFLGVLLSSGRSVKVEEIKGDVERWKTLLEARLSAAETDVSAAKTALGKEQERSGVLGSQVMALQELTTQLLVKQRASLVLVEEEVRRRADAVSETAAVRAELLTVRTELARSEKEREELREELNEIKAEVAALQDAQRGGSDG